MSVSAPSKHPSPARAVKEEQIYITFYFFCLSPTHSIYELKGAETKCDEGCFSFYPVVTLNVFFFYMQYFAGDMF